MLLGFGREREQLVLVDDAGHHVAVVLLKWIPAHVADLLLVDERFVRGVALVVGDREDLVERASDQIAVVIPIAVRHFFAVL